MSPPATARPLRWLLDTNIVSEPVRARPNPRVVHALLKHQDELALPATAWQEMHFGWLLMPEGRPKLHVGHFLQRTVAHIPVLPLDAAAARVQAELRSQAQKTGRPMSYADSEVAAIALANRLTLVTRNTRDFKDRLGLQLANWFEA